MIFANMGGRRKLTDRLELKCEKISHMREESSRFYLSIRTEIIREKEK